MRHLREWLGITAEQTALLARVAELEKKVENLGSGQFQTCQDMEHLRRILTEKQPKPNVIRARNWSEAVRAMGEEALTY